MYKVAIVKNVIINYIEPYNRISSIFICDTIIPSNRKKKQEKIFQLIYTVNYITIFNFLYKNGYYYTRELYVPFILEKKRRASCDRNLFHRNRWYEISKFRSILTERSVKIFASIFVSR